MKLHTFESKRHPHLGAELNGRLVDLNAAHAARLGQRTAVLAPTMHDLIRGGAAALRAARQAVAFAAKDPKRARAFTHDFARVKLLAPLPRPGKILCSGLNYRSHIEEEPGCKMLDDPRFFVKVSSAVIGPGEPILTPGEKFQIDYEVELQWSSEKRRVDSRKSRHSARRPAEVEKGH